MAWGAEPPPRDGWRQRLHRHVRELGFFGTSGVVIFALILLWSARDWFGIY